MCQYLLISRYITGHNIDILTDLSLCKSGQRNLFEFIPQKETDLSGYCTAANLSLCIAKGIGSQTDEKIGSYLSCQLPEVSRCHMIIQKH